MYSTLKNINYNPPSLGNNAVCGIYLVMEGRQDRKAEGGLRLKGHYKKPGPGKPLITVITVVLNRGKTIEQCLLSVLEQTYENIEYLIVDGASTDGTLDIIQKYEAAVDYYVSEPDSGIYNAMNKGLSLATGNYILFLNADDWYRKDAVELLLSNAVSSNADVTYADAYIVNSEGVLLRRLDSWLHDGLYTRGAPLRHETMLVKADIYNKFGNYDESYYIIADYDFMITLYHESCSFSHVPQPLLYFRNNGISSVDYEKRQADRVHLFRKLFPFLDDEDLSIMKRHGRLSTDTRLKLIEKHKGKSELFIRSMAYNIADQVIYEKPEHRPATFIRTLVSFFRKALKNFR